MTIKALVVGLILCVVLSTFEIYSLYVAACGGFCADFMNAGALVIFFLLVGIMNKLLSLVNKKLALNLPELFVVYIMLIIACTIPSWGFVANLLPILCGLRYYASPTNRWEEIIHPHVPSWIAPKGETVVRYFFEGLPEGASIPWGGWVVPLIFWTIFIVAFYGIMIFMMNILRKQFVENERLVFPLNVPALEMSKGRSFFINRLMWLGFAISFLFNFWNGLSHYLPILPKLSLGKWISIFRETTPVYILLSFPVLGFTYFLNSDIAFSLWFFHLLDRIINGFSAITGFTGGVKGHIETFCETLPFLSHAAMGSMIVFVGYTLWLSRAHLKEVFRKAVFNKGLDDSNEMLSYRTSVIGLIVSLFIVCICLSLSGMGGLFIIMFLFSAFVIFLTMTKVIAQGGIGVARPICIPQVFCAYGVPTKMVSHMSLTSLGFTYTYAGDIRTILMTSVLHGLKIADSVGLKKRSLLPPIGLSIIFTLLASYICLIYISYKFGGLTFMGHGDWSFKAFAGPVAWGFVEDKIRHPITTDMVTSRWIWTGIGGLFMFFLMFMHYRFIWWPIHYIGVPLCSNWVMVASWFSIFLGWLIKILIMKYGGIKIYRSGRPFFIGLILGQLMAAGLWAVVSCLVGNRSPVGIIVGIE